MMLCRGYFSLDFVLVSRPNTESHLFKSLCHNLAAILLWDTSCQDYLYCGSIWYQSMKFFITHQLLTVVFAGMFGFIISCTFFSGIFETKKDIHLFLWWCFILLLHHRSKISACSSWYGCALV